MMMPVRIQRKRTKGWKMPENTLYVGRPSRFGNPYVAGQLKVLGYTETGKSISVTPKDAEHAVRLFREYANKYKAFFREQLQGKNLACWCRIGDFCHADVLLKLANPMTNTGGEDE